MNKDIEATVKKFFESVYRYTNNIWEWYAIKGANVKQIIEQINVVKAQEGLIAKIFKEKSNNVVDTYKLNQLATQMMEQFPGRSAFVKPNSDDNSMLEAYRGVIHGIMDYVYYGLPVEKFLEPLKQWYFLTSNKSMKGLIYPFLPLKHFIVKEHSQSLQK